MRRACLILLCLVCWGSGVAIKRASADDGSKFSVGDRVIVERLGKKIEGQVIEIVNRSGWIKVRFFPLTDKSPRNEQIFPPSRVELSAQQPPNRSAKKTGAKDPNAPVVRTWSDQSGKFKIRASLVQVDGEMVELQKEDGDVVKIELAKLNESDQKYARDYVAKLAAAKKAAEDNPFKTTEPAEGAAPAAKTADKKELASARPSASIKARTEPAARDVEKPTALPEQKANWLGTQALFIDAGAKTGTFTPDAAVQPVKLPGHGIVLLSPGKAAGRLAFRDVFPAPVSHQAIVVFSKRPATADDGRPPSFADRRKADDEPTRLFIERCDLIEGRPLAGMDLPATGVDVLDVDPSGQRLLTRLDGGHNKTGGRLDVFEFSGGKWAHVVSWRPNSAQGEDAPCHWAAFVDAEHVLTFDRNKLTFWKVKETKALWTLDAAGGSPTDSIRSMLSTKSGLQPALSATRRQVALLTSSGIVVLDAKTGKLQRRLVTDAAFSPRFAFKPDGTQLAYVDNDSIETWDLATGKRVADIALKSEISSRELSWIADNYLLLHGGGGSSNLSLIDLQRRVVLWKYTADKGMVWAGNYWFVQSDGNSAIMGHTPLPHAAAVEVARGLDPEKMLILKPGAEVVINVEGKMPSDDRKDVLDELTEKLQAINMKVVDRSNVVLVAKVDDTTKVTYKTSGTRMSPHMTGTVTSGSYELYFQDSGKTIWKTSSSRGTATFSVSRHHSRVHSTSKARPLVDFFADSKLPRYLAEQPPSGSYGSSKITAGGIQ